MDTIANPPRSTALITGASSGVGYELTVRLLREGWDVVAWMRSEVPDHDPVVAAARASGRLRSDRVDLADPVGLAAALDRVRSRERSIDLVVNNAALSLAQAQPGPSGRDVHFDVNVLSPYAITTALLPCVAASEHKTILNVASNALLSVKQFSLAELVHPTRFKKLFGPYAASKLALALWTHELARALPPDVELRSVCPGPSDTPMTRGPGMPRWLGMLVPLPLLFPHPRRGADRLHAAGLGAHRGERGVFIHRDRVTPLPWLAQAPAVLAAVRDIHARSFPVRPGQDVRPRDSDPG
ncbi:SDR family NAD(P)-dependent oxidoreductase [Nannocystis pusilla]|uniref:SDR family NAD(P)-dependent oxidoreductase n=1 Tax=Nannocystis pusilla TaxID=889268 RepID=UPI003BF0F3FA